MTVSFRHGLALSALLSVMALSPAHALSMKECSAKYREAKQNNTLGGADWKSFRATQCASASAETPVAAADTGSPGAAKSAPAPATTAAAPAAVPAAAAPATTDAPPAAAPAGSGKTARPAAAPVDTGNAVFPSTVNPKYSSLTAGKARMKTCLDQYHANKASNGNGGLNWIQKGGGYYSACTRKLKAG